MNDSAPSLQQRPWQFSLTEVLGVMVGIGFYLGAWRAEAGPVIAGLTLAGAAACEGLAARRTLDSWPALRAPLRLVACLLAFAGPWLLFVGTRLLEVAPLVLHSRGPSVIPFFFFQGGFVIVQTLGASMVFGISPESRARVAAGLIVVAVMSLWQTLFAMLLIWALASR